MADAAPAAVFLSYASQDAAAVLRIAEALRTADIEVWFDQNELVGGDQWDQKIRGQVKTCTLFVPVISAATQARLEGYFRLEWKLAAQRTHTMADAKPFLLPVVIDATRDAEAHVPEEFRAVQWTRLPGGETPEKFCARVKKLLGGEVAKAGPVADRPGLPPERSALRTWILPAIIVTSVVVKVAVWQPWKKSTPPPASPAVAAPAAPLTEAQQLVAKARKIFDEGDDMSRETYALAEEFLTKAETLDPGEASAWALHARLSMLRSAYSLDRTTARAEALRMQADRVARLAPGSLEARLAGAYARYIFSQFEAVEPELKDLAAKFPNDWRVQQQLGRTLVRLDKTEEAVVCFNRALQLLPDDPTLKCDLLNAYLSSGQFVKGQDFVTQALRGRTDARLLGMRAFFDLIWSGDLTTATAAIGHWPPWFLQEDRGAACATLVALWRGDDARALELAGQFPRDYLRDFMFTGPRAVLSAWAHEHAGHTASALAECRAASRCRCSRSIRRGTTCARMRRSRRCCPIRKIRRRCDDDERFTQSCFLELRVAGRGSGVAHCRGAAREWGGGLVRSQRTRRRRCVGSEDPHADPGVRIVRAGNFRSDAGARRGVFPARVETGGRPLAPDGAGSAISPADRDRRHAGRGGPRGR